MARSEQLHHISLTGAELLLDRMLLREASLQMRLSLSEPWVSPGRLHES